MLARLTRQLSADWQRAYNYRPVVVETFVERDRFAGTSYRAAIWMAVDVKAWHPRIAPLPLKLVRFSGAALTAGVETHIVEGVPVRITSAAKTVVDCFKYRNKIGIDVAVEALRDCRRKRACTNDDLRRYAAICRVTNVMQPSLEAVA